MSIHRRGVWPYTEVRVINPKVEVKLRLWNRCKECRKTDRGVVSNLNGKRVWACPHCLNMQGYP